MANNSDVLIIGAGLAGAAAAEALAQRGKVETAKWAKAIKDAKIEPQ